MQNGFSSKYVVGLENCGMYNYIKENPTVKLSKLLKVFLFLRSSWHACLCSLGFAEAWGYFSGLSVISCWGYYGWMLLWLHVTSGSYEGWRAGQQQQQQQHQKQQALTAEGKRVLGCRQSDQPNLAPNWFQAVTDAGLNLVKRKVQLYI